MWSGILINLASSIIEATFISSIGKVNKRKFNKELKKIINSEFNQFADTSLDCDDFAKIINSSSFINLVRNYFFSISENKRKEEYLNSFEKYICLECPSVQKTDVRNFIKKIESIYVTFLYKTIENDIKLNTFFQSLRLAHKEIVDRILDSEEHLLKYLKNLDKPPVEITNETVIEYHKVCQSDFGIVRFTGISGVENRPSQNIDRFYIENDFVFWGEEITRSFNSNLGADDLQIHIKLKDFFKYNNKIVLIGAAGLGKSTTLNYLFCNYEKMFNQKPLKIKIDLKEYAKSIADEKRTVLWCLSQEFYRRIQKKQMSFDDIESSISEFLSDGNGLIIFDALDEIPNQDIRTKVRDEIASFCKVYPLNRYIISTREVGYLKNQFDTSFIHIRINEFNDKQIKEYGQKWIDINYKYSDVDQFWDKFEKEVERAKCKALIRNPIILILALVIFDIEKNLPNKRVEFYKKCIDTFLIVREDRKNAFPKDDNFKNIIGDNSVVPRIAYYKFNKTKEDMDYRFTHEELENAIMEAIEVPDKRNWFNATNLFAKYLVNRTELIREIDENILDFAHKTFYEYFLATYYAKEMETDEIITLLHQWIGDANFNELAKLIIEVIIERNEVKQHKQVIEYLFKEIDDNYNNFDRDKLHFCNILFDIIVELNNNNMILAKYQHKYYKCLVYHAILIYYHKRRSFFNSDNVNSINYCKETLMETYVANIDEDKDNFYRMIDCFYFIDDTFGESICSYYKNEPMYKYLNILGKNAQSTKSTNDPSVSKQSIIEAVHFFLNEQLSVVLKSPEIYLSILNILIKYDMQNELSLLTKCHYDRNNKFEYYIEPFVLIEHLYHCHLSPNYFITLLIGLIRCGKKQTNYYINYALNHISENIDKKNDKKIIEIIERNTINLLKWLNGKTGYDDLLKNYHVSNPAHLDICQELFNEYQINEKHINNNLGNYINKR